MRITIAAVGRLRSGPERELVALYLERARPLGRRAGISVIEMREHPESTAATPELRRAEEAGRLVAGLSSSAAVVVLDESGRSLTSAEFARHLQHLAGQGTGETAFLLGGPDGHDQDLRERAGLALAFGSMTWPHRLARVMLAEQIYRAVTILVNHPYHRA